MNQRDKWVLGIGAAAVAGAVLLAVHPHLRSKIELQLDTADTTRAYGDEYRHVPWDPCGAEQVHPRHPLFRRPCMSSPHFAMLSAGGWEWFCNPPSETG